MAVNFPDSPSNGQTFTSGALTFTWNGEAWKLDPSSGTKGEKGQKGEVGVTGDKGQKGQKGEVGDKGQKGEIGPVGGSGGAGAKGQKGEDGTGADGVKGDKGATGAGGDKGQKGEVGAGGSDGSDGDKGQKGEAGAAASKGQKGEAGTNGSNGSDGSDGDKGQKGDKGQTGATGSQTFTVTNSGASAYQIDGSNNPTLTLVRGFTYTFNVNASGHPFYIKTSASTGTGNQYTTGVTNNGVQVGTLTFVVPSNAPATLYYICQYHSSMVGTINTVENGQKGEKGQKGDTGAQGSQGNTGSTGSQGQKGEPGAGGSGGAKGQKGEVGATGGTGSTGAKGQKGEVGATGGTGGTGSTGAKGQKGEVGSGGSAGSDGSDGDKGQKGEVGAGGPSILPNASSNPSSPSSGQLYFNTSTGRGRLYNGSEWTPFGGTLPTFLTNAGNIGTLYNNSLSNGDWSIAALSVDSNAGSVTFEITSGSLPSGMSMSTSGAFSGTVNGVGSDTTYTFTVSITNDIGTRTRQFNIIQKAEVTENFSYSGSTVTWSRPTNVKYVAFRMWGGAGTHGRCASNGNYPGRGGKTEGTINVSSHSQLYLQVGEAGKTYSNEPNAGWPNGGEGNNEHMCQAAGGGGSSNIYNSSGTGSYSNVIAVAGGGGSVSHGNPVSNGGDGGGTNGGSSNRGGGGASQNAGGSQSTTPCGNTGNAGVGTRMQGGDAGGGGGCTNSGAGGGGGWWGGGAGGNSNGGNSYGGSGGGSGYYDTNLVSSGSTKQASESGWGTNKPSGIADRASHGDNNRGGHGYISLRY